MESSELRLVLNEFAAYAPQRIISEVPDLQGMAKSKIQPAELCYNFILPTSGSPITSYIDLAQCASAVNRRLYHQGKNYYVSRIVMASTNAAKALISTLPDNWVTANAWVKAKSMWDTMNKGVLHDNPSGS